MSATSLEQWISIVGKERCAYRTFAGLDAGYSLALSVMVDAVVGIETSGFIFDTPLAYLLA